jgi:hypothetical protein
VTDEWRLIVDISDRRGELQELIVKVICESAAKLTLYTDGAIHDVDDVRIGRHDLILTKVDGRQSLARKRLAKG